MKWFVAVLFILTFSVAIFTPTTLASAADNVTYVATDNFTIGFSDNLTVLNSGNITISGDVGLKGLNDSLQNIVNKTLTTLIGLIIIIVLVILAFWHRDPIMYVLAGFSFILYGFTLWATSWYLSILLVVAGMALLIKAGIDRKKKK